MQHKHSTFFRVLFVILLCKLNSYSQVGIGTNTPSSSAMLDVSANNKGMLVPRMTAAQRTAINLPATGLLVYQTDGQTGFYYNTGTPGLPNWTNIMNGTATPELWSVNGSNIYNLNSGNVGIGTTTPSQKLDVVGNVNIPLDSCFMINSAKVISLKGNQNVFVGSNLALLNTGIQNSGFGNAALFNNTTGSGNSAFGRAALAFNISGTDNSAFGRQAMQMNNSGNNNAVFGADALKSNTSGNSNVAIGAYALSGSNASDNTAIGYAAQLNNTTGTSNTSVGSESLLASNTGSNNTAIGYQSLYHNAASYNTALGWWSMYKNNTGTSNTAIGEEALYANTSGNGNTALGAASLYKNTTENGSTAVGSNALFNSTGSSNTAVGSSALSTNTIGTNNTSIGNGADVSVNNLTNATAIGFAAFVNASNKISLGNSLVTQIGGFANWSVFSDGRFKENVTESVPGLLFINNLRPVMYTINARKIDAHIMKNLPDSVRDLRMQSDDAYLQSSKIMHTGFVAQEVETAAKKIGFKFDGVYSPKNTVDNYSISYAQFVVPLVKSVQELSSENIILNEKLKKQEAEIDALRTEIEKVKLKLR